MNISLTSFREIISGENSRFTSTIWLTEAVEFSE